MFDSDYSLVNKVPNDVNDQLEHRFFNESSKVHKSNNLVHCSSKAVKLGEKIFTNGNLNITA